MEIVDVQFIGNQDKYQQYEPKDVSLLNTVTISNPFGSDEDYIEYFIYDVNGNLLASNYFVNTYSPVNPDPQTGNYTTIGLTPEEDAKSEGYNRGTVDITYNFFRKLFSSDITRTFWIKEISGDRTELRVCRQDLSNLDLQQAFTDYTNIVSLKAYYPDFYLNFGNNNILIGVNVLYALQDDQGSLLIKLYEPLPDTIELKDTFWIVDKLSDSANYTIDIEVPAEVVVEQNTLRGPNYNIDIIERVGQTTPLYNYSNIFQTDLSASYQQLKSLMEEKGLDINVDYTDFNNYIHFSSATERIYNFAYKVQQIENYTSDIAALQSVAANGTIASGSKDILQNNINNIIEKFDGYEYYLYYTSASDAWPKSGSYQPYSLYSVTSSQALSWLGSPETEPSPTSYSILYSASLYDINNPNALNNTIPAYLKEDSNNQPYQTFLTMVGQHFDNIWIYLKDVTERYDADNHLDKGISKDLVADALRGLGIKLYTNTSISDNIYYSLLAINPNGTLSPPTGQEFIQYYIPFSANGLYVVAEYVDPDYVEAFEGGGTIPGDDVTKEYYKRIYHNVPYLLKTRGTARGLKALINCFGIPDTILRINEFGGTDKLRVTPDLIQRRHSLAYYNSGSSNLSLPWVGQNYYYVSGGLRDVLPDTIEFRFKSTGIPDSNHISQSIFQIGRGATTQVGLNLVYDSSSAVLSSSYENYGNLRLYLSGTQGYAKTSPISLPFYDPSLWWSIMIKREVGSGQAQSNSTSNRYWVYAKSTAYNEEGNAQITYQGSQSIYVDGATSSSYNRSWNTYNTSSYSSTFAAYLGGTGSNNTLSPNSGQFQGYFQEFRYWAAPLSESAFDEHVINSTSYRGNDSTASLFNLTFRLPLGSNLNIPYRDVNGVQTNPKDYDLYELGIAGVSSSAVLTSYHPAITGTLILPFNGQPTSGVPSFISGSTAFSYGIFGNEDNIRYFQPYEITDLIPTPSTGVNQKVNNKVSVVAEDNLTETLLSPYVSIQKYDSSISKNSTDIEVGFAPSDALDLDISNQLGYFNIDEYIGDPSNAYTVTYPSLDTLRTTYFDKYTPQYYTWWSSGYNVKDFIRLIKYYDNSLFKMIKDFVPARANLSTGIIVKPHILERPKYVRNEPIVSNEAYWSGSIDMVSISGSNPEDMYLNTAYTSSIVTPLGTVIKIQTDLRQPFTGDFGGNEIQGASDYFSQTEISSIIAPWTSSVQNANKIFTTYSINPLENNVPKNTRSTYRLSVDYSTNPNTPVNLGIITGALALYPVRAASPGSTVLSSPTWPFAEVNDYNWEAYSRVNPRYEGSRIYSLLYNVYTSASVLYIGDSSYGKTAVIDKIKKKFAYLKKFSAPTLVLPNRGNAEIKYLIDQDQNVTDLSKTNPNIFDVQNIFKSGETLDISLFDYDTADPAIQRLANNKTLGIYQGGFRYYPILHNLSGSHVQVFNFFPPLEITVTDTTTGGGTVTVPTGVTNPASWSVTWYADSPSSNQHQFNITYNGPGGGSGGNMPAGEYTASVSIFFAGNTVNYLVPLAAWLNAGTMPAGVVVAGRGGAISILGRFFGGGTSTTDFGGNYVNTVPPPPDYYIGGGITPLSTNQYQLTALGSGSGGTTTITSTTYYTTTVTSSISQSCFYALTSSNVIAFAGAVAQYYNYNLLYSSSSDPDWSASLMEPVAIPFSIDIGDEIHIYNSQVGWFESEEYFIAGKSFIGTGTGSRLLITLDRPINQESLRPITADPIYGWSTGSCRYIVVKKIPDETNIIVRYDPKVDITQEGTLYPQYIEPALRTAAGDIIQSLKSDNLI